MWYTFSTHLVYFSKIFVLAALDFRNLVFKDFLNRALYIFLVWWAYFSSSRDLYTLPLVASYHYQNSWPRTGARWGSWTRSWCCSPTTSQTREPRLWSGVSSKRRASFLNPRLDDTLPTSACWRTCSLSSRPARWCRAPWQSSPDSDPCHLSPPACFYLILPKYYYPVFIMQSWNTDTMFVDQNCSAWSQLQVYVQSLDHSGTLKCHLTTHRYPNFWKASILICRPF